MLGFGCMVCSLEVFQCFGGLDSSLTFRYFSCDLVLYFCGFYWVPQLF